jgi:hypothetical protein
MHLILGKFHYSSDQGGWYCSPFYGRPRKKMKCTNSWCKRNYTEIYRKIPIATFITNKLPSTWWAQQCCRLCNETFATGISSKSAWCSFTSRICRILQQCVEDPFYSSHVFFTGKEGFTENGTLNFHNRHMWSGINPHSTIQSKISTVDLN